MYMKTIDLPLSARRSNFTFTFHFHAWEKEMATHSSVLAWRIPGTVEPGGLPSMGSHRVGHDWSDLAAAAAAAAPLFINTGSYQPKGKNHGHFWPPDQFSPHLTNSDSSLEISPLTLRTSCQTSSWVPSTAPLLLLSHGFSYLHDKVGFPLKANLES